MLRFLYQAVDIHQKKTSGFIEAENIAEARALLEKSGHTAIEFLDDAENARLRMMREKTARLNPENSEPEYSDPDRSNPNRLNPAIQAELEINLRRMNGPGPSILAFIKNDKQFFIVLAGWIVFGLSTGRWLIFGIGVAVLALIAAYFVYNYLPAYWYDKILRCMTFGEWDQASSLINRLRKRTKRDTILFDLDVRQACIDAKHGQLAKGLAAVEAWRDRMSEPGGIFAGRLAAVYLAAGDTAGYIQHMENAFRVSSGDRSRLIDFALAHARFGDLAEAESLLASLNTDDLPKAQAGFLRWVRGLILLRKDDAENALNELAQSVQLLLEHTVRPAIWGTLALVNAYLSLALARTGDKLRARQIIQPALPILNAHAGTALADMLNQEVLEGQVILTR